MSTPVISKIKPLGGGDYTTLQAWMNDVSAEAVPQWAECYGGKNLGSVQTIQPTGFTPDVNNYFRIYAAPGQRHCGWCNPCDKCAFIRGSGGLVVVYRMNWLRIEGLKLYNTDASGHTISLLDQESSNADYVTIDGCMFVNESVGSGGAHIIVDNGYSNVSTGVRIRNNIIYGNGTRDYGIYLSSVGSNEPGTITDCRIDNNTIYGVNTNGFMTYRETGGKGGDCSISCTLRNNIIVNSGTADYVWDVDAATVLNNISHDGTADDNGGSNNQVNVAANLLFRDPGTDNRLRKSASAKDRGTPLQYEFNTDVCGVHRPQFAEWDIGAYEYPEDEGNVP